MYVHVESRKGLDFDRDRVVGLLPYFDLGVVIVPVHGSRTRCVMMGVRYGRYVTFETSQAYPELVVRLRRKPQRLRELAVQESGEAGRGMVAGTRLVIDGHGSGTVIKFSKFWRGHIVELDPPTAGVPLHQVTRIIMPTWSRKHKQTSAH
eukprot:COSAG05_NODE_2775_length_2652_cov_2.252252_2_plen_150_part_00